MFIIKGADPPQPPKKIKPVVQHCTLSLKVIHKRVLKIKEVPFKTLFVNPTQHIFLLLDLEEIAEGGGHYDLVNGI